MAYVTFTDAFFNDTFANESFFPAVERGRIYRARRLSERQADLDGVDYMVNIKGHFVTQCAIGFIHWHDEVPVRSNEIEIRKGAR